MIYTVIVAFNKCIGNSNSFDEKNDACDHESVVLFEYGMNVFNN